MYAQTLSESANSSFSSNVGPSRQDLILRYYPLVRTIAYRFARRLPASVDMDELVNVGVLGLMDAIDRFDPLRGVPFKSYAEIRIQGSMYDSLRGDDWVPRSVRRKANRIDRARADFVNSCQRNPTREEMAESLQLTVEEYDALAADARINRLVSLDATTTEDGATPLADTLPRMDPSVEQNLCMDELGMEVEHAVACLPDKERVAVTLYYMQNMTLKEIGAVLGVTESRACQLRSQGVKRLQYRLRNAMP